LSKEDSFPFIEQDHKKKLKKKASATEDGTIANEVLNKFWKTQEQPNRHYEMIVTVSNDRLEII
jgi:hypothetical protein